MILVNFFAAFLISTSYYFSLGEGLSRKDIQ